MVKFGYRAQFLGIVNDQNKLMGATLLIYKEVFMGMVNKMQDEDGEIHDEAREAQQS